jgi:DNA-binding NarL/FixJ family response regulator
VRLPQDLLSDPHLTDVGFFEPHFASETPVIRSLRQAVNVEDVASGPDLAPPMLGADTAAVLREAGLSEDEIAEAIREEFPDTAVVALSAYVQVERATALLASGERSGYLLKTRVTDVEEHDAAVVATTVDPAADHDLSADVGGTKVAGSIGAHHRVVSSSFRARSHATSASRETSACSPERRSLTAFGASATAAGLAQDCGIGAEWSHTQVLFHVRNSRVPQSQGE